MVRIIDWNQLRTFCFRQRRGTTLSTNSHALSHGPVGVSLASQGYFGRHSAAQTFVKHRHLHVIGR